MRREAAQIALQTGQWFTMLNGLDGCGLLCAATTFIPDPGAGGAYGPVLATLPATPAQVITADGMPGWQIALIAVAAAVFLAWAWASGRAASAAR